MESNDNSRLRQSNVPVDLTHSQHQQEQPSQFAVPDLPSTFRQPLVQSSSASTSAVRSDNGGVDGSAYNLPFGQAVPYPGMQMATVLQYQPEYAAGSSARDAHATVRHYSQYGSEIPYGPQSILPSTPYETMQRYQQQQRQIAPQHYPPQPAQQRQLQQQPTMAAAEVLTSQFSTPPSQYYVPAASELSTARQSSTISPQALPHQYQSLQYAQQSPVTQNREPLASAFTTPVGVAHMSPASAHGNTVQAATGYSAQARAGQDVEAQLDQYKIEIRKVNENVRDGRLAEAAGALTRVTEWLLSHVEILGLTRDEEELRSERLSLWEDLNHTWLTMLQKQKDTCRLGQASSMHQMLIGVDMLYGMADELVRLCDGIEKHGLVDYQVGVWEESILDLLISCLDTLEQNPGR